MKMTNDARRQTYYRLSSLLAELDNEQLRVRLEKKVENQGWGKTDTITLGGTKVFVKRVPVTDVEYANQFSTKNHYGLPTYYNYGIWSGGFGVFRELVAHIKTTNWVLAGAIETFPLMYHYRIVPWPKTPADFTEEELQAYVAYWGGNAQIETYIRDRDCATHQLLIFLEWFPDSLENWLLRNPDQLSRALKQMKQALAFLRQQEIIHFDCDFGNIVTDGTTFCLTDFGLLLDRKYDLSAEEQLFFDRHRDYDITLLLAAIGWHIDTRYRTLPAAQQAQLQERCAITQGMNFGERTRQLVQHIETPEIGASLGLDDQFVAIVVKYRMIILWMVDFISELRGSPQKNVPFQAATISKLLQETALN